MNLARVLAGANLLAWIGLVLARDPLPPEFFTEQDRVRKEGRFLLRSSDPPLVLAGRPLRSWTWHHGGEAPAVKVLEVLNVLPLAAAGVVVLLLGSLNAVSAFGLSVVAFGLVIGLTSLQWWGLGMLFQKLGARRRSTAT